MAQSLGASANGWASVRPHRPRASVFIDRDHDEFGGGHATISGSAGPERECYSSGTEPV